VAVDRIVAWLRLRDAARFRRDAHRAAAAIKDINRAAKSGEEPLTQLGGGLSELVSTIPSLTGRTRIFGFALGTVLTAFVAVIPLVVGLGGALTALAGSMGAAALGAGALTVALAGVALPAGALALVAVDLLQGFSKVATAFQRYQVAVKAFGRQSTQAETALSRLNAIAEIYGGRSLVMAAEAWNKFIDAFRKANRPAIQNLAGIFSDFLQFATKLLPVFGSLTAMASKLFRSGLREVFAALSSPEVTAALRSLGLSFATLAGPLMRTVINFLVGFLTMASRFAPFLGYLADDFLSLSESFRTWARTGSISTLVSQFYDWIGLLKSAGRLLYTILSGGASSGQSLVQSLTETLDRWNAILSTKKGQDDLRNFFRDSVEMTKEFSAIMAGLTRAFFIFGRALVPIYTRIFGGLRQGWAAFMDAIRPAAPYWHNVLGPIIKGVIDGIVSGFVGASKVLLFVLKVWATYFGILGKLLKPLRAAFYLAGQVIGIIFGGEILKALEVLSRFSIILRPLGKLMGLLSLPIRMVGRVVGELASAFSRLLYRISLSASRIFGPIRSAINAVLSWLTGSGARFYNVGVRLWRAVRDGVMNAIGSGIGFGSDLAKGVWNFIANRFNKFLPDKIGPRGIINLPDNPLPMLAGGGVVSGRGSWITGEAGPEINTLRDGKVVVQPLTSSVRAPTSGTVMPRGGERPIYVSKIYLKGRQIAEAVADEFDDEKRR
jgi:phage-related protein